MPVFHLSGSQILTWLRGCFSAVAFGVMLASFLGSEALGRQTVAPRCSGQDLLARLAQTDPAAHASVLAEAGRIPNDGAVLWRIEVPARLQAANSRPRPVPPSFLFGTIHVTDPRVVEIPVPARAALERANVVALEIVDISPTMVNHAIAALGPDIVFPEGASLADYLTDEEQATLVDLLTAQGLPGRFALRFKPWFLSAMLALPVCERRRSDAGLPALDIRLERLAETLAIPTLGLETLISQFEVMASLPLQAQLSWLRTSIALQDAAEDDLETLIQLYLQRRVATVWAFNRQRLANDPDLTVGIEDFQLTLIDRRNREMLEAMRPLINGGRAFVAVGALHLPGENGLVALLRKAGYVVTAID